LLLLYFLSFGTGIVATLFAEESFDRGQSQIQSRSPFSVPFLVGPTLADDLQQMISRNASGVDVTLPVHQHLADRVEDADVHLHADRL
jgi:hypothetical protein